MSEKNIRKGHRNAVSRYISAIEEFIQDGDFDVDKLQSYKIMLTTQKEKIQVLDEIIHNSLDDDALESDMLDSEEIHFNIIQRLVTIDRLIKTKSDLSNGQPSNRHGFSRIKLPAIQLSKFSGDSMKWPSFRDDFVAVIHNCADLENTQKLGYLKGQLTGDALKLVEGFAITNEHYREVWDLLETTFGKPDKIIIQHLHALFDLRSPSFETKSLSNFRSQYECHIRGLHSMKKDVKHSGYVFATLLMKKLPNKIQEHLNRLNDGKLWELDPLREAITKEIELLSTMEQESGRSANYLKEADSSNGISTASNFELAKDFYSEGKEFNYQKKICPLCTESHFVFYCKKYSDVHSKIERAKELKLCFNCLRQNHIVADCRIFKRCAKCNGKHHSSLCYNAKQTEKKPESTSDTQSASTSAEASISVVLHSRRGVSLPIGSVPIQTNGQITHIKTVFDQCAQTSIILSATVKRLRLKVIRKERVALNPYNSKGETLERFIARVPINLQDSDSSIEAIVVDELNEEIKIPGLKSAIGVLREKNVDFPAFLGDSDVVRNIEMLIGADYYYTFVFGHRIVRGIHLIRTKFGELISGPLPFKNENDKTYHTNSLTVLKIATSDENSTDEQFKRLWDLDSIGLIDSKSTTEEEILQQFEEGISYEDSRYTVRLPWKPEHASLPSNFNLARTRLNSTLKKLRQNSEHLQQYSKVMQEQLDRGFIEKVENVYSSDGKTKMLHYLSHQAVLKKSATTPVRVVFDCSAATKGNPSLNDCLFSGPSLVQDMSKILLRFRVHKYASVSDISKAFLMVGLHEEDRDCTRFFWPTNPNDPKSEIQIYRFRVVLFGATCSQFLLNSTILHHLSRVDSPCANLIARNLYIDNLQSVAPDEETLIASYHESKQIMQAAGMTLREWTSNSGKLETIIEREKDGIRERKQSINVLGAGWNRESDTLQISKFTMNDMINTKRSVLRHSASIFDPLGYISPIIIRSRQLLQVLWKMKLDWDEPILDEQKMLWQNLLDDFNNLHKIIIPRSLVQDVTQQIDIHAFSDASEKSYGAVVYFVVGDVSSIVISKARVAPIKKLTIPQLELSAAVLSARLIHYVMEAYSRELKFKDITMWIDSQIVLAWIKSEKDLKPFIKNRVHEIATKTPKCTAFKYVQSVENPADLLSRGTSTNDLMKSKLWFDGPAWLVTKRKECDTRSLLNPKSINDRDLVLVMETIATDNEMNPVIDAARYSDYNKLLRVVAYVFHFCDVIRRRTLLEENGLSLVNIERAECYMIRSTQLFSYSEEIKSCEENLKHTNLMKQLGLYLDKNGILRCKGRLEYADLPEAAKNPILLPSNHLFTKLLIKKYHSMKHHSGVEYLVASLRQRFWIPKIRQAVKKVLKTCIMCKRLHALSYNVPPPGQLPEVRVTQDKPFQITGIDYTGYLIVKDGKLQKKVYVALFTCGLTRAVHLELVEDNSAETFIRAFRRFVGRRSIPRIVYSDNATTFLASANHLKDIRNHPSVKSFALERRFEWRTIPARAAWYGGFWERIVGLTKTAIKKTLGRSFINMDDMRTILVEIEASLNDRPLTYSSDNPLDLDALTPSKLIYGFRITEFPTPVEEPDETFMERSILSSRQRRCEELLQRFWSKWRNEYLTSLRERHIQQLKSKKKSGAQHVQEGDVVIIQDDNRPRIHWKLGLVEKLISGSDDEVRSVILRTSNGTTHRPIAKLFPLEVQHVDNRLRDEVQLRVQKSTSSAVKTKRMAAIAARTKIQSQLEDIAD